MSSYPAGRIGDGTADLVGALILSAGYFIQCLNDVFPSPAGLPGRAGIRGRSAGLHGAHPVGAAGLRPDVWVKGGDYATGGRSRHRDPFGGISESLSRGTREGPAGGPALPGQDRACVSIRTPPARGMRAAASEQ